MLIGYADMERLAKHLNVFEEDCPFSGPEGVVEHLAHEVGHAMSLGWRPFRGMEQAVGLTLSMDRTPAQARRNEALVLAAEAIVLPRLGIHYREEYAGQTMRDAAEVQGVPDKVYWRMFGSKAARELGVRVLRYLGRRAGAGRRS